MFTSIAEGRVDSDGAPLEQMEVEEPPWAKEEARARRRRRNRCICIIVTIVVLVLLAAGIGGGLGYVLTLDNKGDPLVVTTTTAKTILATGKRDNY